MEKWFWVLYTSIPCLLGILGTKFLSSFALLVRSTHILLSENIIVKDLEQCRIDLIQFTGNCEQYYGFSAMTFNTHALVHVIEHVYKSGPLCMTSTFPFENGIFVLKQKLTGPKGVLKQMSKRLIQKTILESRLLNPARNESSKRGRIEVGALDDHTSRFHGRYFGHFEEHESLLDVR